MFCAGRQVTWWIQATSSVFPFSLCLELGCTSVIQRLARGLGHVYTQNLALWLSHFWDFFLLTFQLLVLSNLSSLLLQANKTVRNSWVEALGPEWDLLLGQKPKMENSPSFLMSVSPNLPALVCSLVYSASCFYSPSRVYSCYLWVDQSNRN